jgi:hypothetical protein
MVVAPTAAKACNSPVRAYNWSSPSDRPDPNASMADGEVT